MPGGAPRTLPAASARPPPTHSTPASSLKPPLAERCVFYRTQEDSGTPPTLSRMTSSNALVQNPTTGEMLSATEFLKQHANVQPLREGEQLELDRSTAWSSPAATRSWR